LSLALPLPSVGVGLALPLSNVGVVVARTDDVNHGRLNVVLANERGQEVQRVDAAGVVLVVAREAGSGRVTDLGSG